MPNLTQPTLHDVVCPDALGSHRMAYWQWGNPQGTHVVLCVHGLTRQGLDFDVLANALCARDSSLRVVAPDMAGRGHSEWLKDPMAYQLPTYAADMLALIAQLQPTTLDWVGSSMGGLIGMVVCGQPGLPLPVAVRKLVLNDVGPALALPALERISQYLGKTGQFTSVEQAADALWSVSSSFGPHTPAQWLALSAPMVKAKADGSGHLTLHYDPAIAQAFKAMTIESALQAEEVMWGLYDQITAQTLLVRGVLSDLVTPETAQAMTRRGPRATLIEFEGVGHAPTFVPDDQVAAVLSFLLNSTTDEESAR